MPAAEAIPETTPTTAEALAALGELQLLSGNAPFLLEGPTTVWWIESGTIEVFSVPLRDGQPAGARSHFMSIPEGSLMFGMNLESFGAGSGFLAAGAMGTRIRRLELDALQTLCSAELHAAELGRLIDLWVQTLSMAVTRDILPLPISHLQVEQNTATANGGADALNLAAGKRMKAKKGTVWIEAHEGDYLFLGMSDLEIRGEELLFPLSEETWLETEADAKFHIRDTIGSLCDSRLTRGLALFHDQICQCEFINKRLVAVDELNRLRTQSRYSDAARHLGLADLARVLNLQTGAPDAAPVDDSVIDLNFETAKLVGTKAGITIKPHPDGKSLDHIARASRIRTRTVGLRDVWWKDDQGPMFGRLLGSRSPVAILPLSPSSYEIVNPATGVHQKVNADVAATLEPFAVFFYRPFPDGPLDLKALWNFARRGLLPDFLRIAIIAVVGGFLGAVGPYFSGQIFDWVIPSADRLQLAQFVGGLAASGIAVAAFNVVRGFALQRIEGRSDGAVQAAMMDRVLQLPTSFFRDYTAGDLAARTGGIDAVRSAVAGSGMSAILSAITGSFNLLLMFWYSSKLAWVALALVAFAVILTVSLNLIQLGRQRALLAIKGKIAGLVFQFVTGISKLRVSGSEDRAFRVWARNFAEQRRLSYAVGTLGNFSSVFNAVYTPLTSMVVFWFVVFMLNAGKTDASAGATGAISSLAAGISPGKFVAFNAAFGVVLSAALGLSSASLSMLAVIPLLERLKPIITTPPEVDAAKSFPGKLSGKIEISHVNFRYRPDGPLVLKDICLSIKPGQFVALAGPSGSGKSTLLRMLLGFETPETGSISYDGQDLQKLDVSALRHRIGVVLQQSSIMPGDIFHNIVGLDESATMESAWEAARMAGMEADIRQMPMQMQTIIGQGGSTFSGGQRQRLMIARAIYGKPRIIFFDEATSALDNQTQQIVTESLDRLQATRIVVAHRLSTIVHADCIVVIDKGQIAQQGTYEELMKQGGPFAELAKRQIA